MKRWAYEEVRDKVLTDLDIAEEDFIGADEMVGYCNAALDEAEAAIHRLGVEDEYFLADAAVALVSGTSSYAMPSDIYANKIRGLVYDDGTNAYMVKRLRRSNQVLAATLALRASAAQDDYQYSIKNPDPTTGPRLVLSPPSRETSSTVMKLWYIRNMARVPLIGEDIGTGGAPDPATLADQEAAIIEVPEFTNFVIAYMKVECAKKGDPRIELFRDELAKERRTMIETLTEMVLDDDNEVEADLTHYEEHS